MNELFKALENFKPRPVNNNYFVELVGDEVVALTNTESPNTKSITVEEYKTVLTHGVENFIYKNKLEKKIQKTIIKGHYKILIKDNNFILFLELLSQIIISILFEVQICLFNNFNISKTFFSLLYVGIIMEASISMTKTFLMHILYHLSPCGGFI